MPLFNLTELRGLLKREQRLIGIDPGTKTIGLALSDVGLRIASPYGTLKRGKLRANTAEIAEIARKERAGGLVVGLPLSMDGSFGPAAQAAHDWALALSDATAPARRDVGRAPVLRRGEPLPDRSGRCQPRPPCRRRGPHGRRLDASGRAGRPEPGISHLHVIICGAGIIGATTAYFLARRGAAVTVIERRAVACAASGKAGGFLALDWSSGTALDALSRRSFELHAQLARDLPGDWGYRRLNTFYGHGPGAMRRL